MLVERRQLEILQARGGKLPEAVKVKFTEHTNKALAVLQHASEIVELAEIAKTMETLYGSMSVLHDGSSGWFSLWRKVERVKDLGPFVRTLRQLGYKRTKTRLPDGDSPTIRLEFEKDGYPVSINAELALNKGICRRVVVGTEMVEQKKYKIFCPEDALEETA